MPGTERADGSHNARIEPEATSIGTEAQAASAARFSLPVSAPLPSRRRSPPPASASVSCGHGTTAASSPEEWLPGGLLLLALLCTAAASVEVRARLRTAPLPLVLFGLYVVWSYLSILWAQVPADALDGANRTLVYWLVFALFTGLGISERAGSAVVLAWGLALAALGVVELIQGGDRHNKRRRFRSGTSIAAPISYADGDAALFLSACLR